MRRSRGSSPRWRGWPGASIRSPRRISARGRRVRILVLLPNTDFHGPAKLFAEAVGFKCGTDQRGLSLARKHQSQQALAGPPADAGVVVERRARGEIEAVECRSEVGHQFPRPGHARLELLCVDGMEAVAQRR